MRRLLDRQVQDAVRDMQVLLTATPVRQPCHGHLPEHGLKRPVVTRFDRLARHPRTVSDPLETLLTVGAEIEMILKQHAQQLTTIARKPSL